MAESIVQVAKEFAAAVLDFIELALDKVFAPKGKS
jgi:hypothetical protein